MQSFRRALVLLVLLSAASRYGDALLAQEPDTLPAAERAPDQVPDSLQAPDSLALQDSVAPADTIVPRFPWFPDPATRRPGIAADWKMRDLLSTGALSFADLIEFTPLLDPVRAGFFDGPQMSVFAGSGPGSFRYDIDGYEIAPLLGGGVDLHLIPLVELQEARMVRMPGGYHAIGHAYRRDRREPYSRVEAGTGDRNTALLRGFFSSRLFGAPFGFGVDRVSTNGVVGPADRTFVWFDFAVPLPMGIWGEVEYRGTRVGRDAFDNISRTDWILRLRRAFSKGWYADVVAGQGKVEREPLEPETLRTASGILWLSGYLFPMVQETQVLPTTDARQVAVRAARNGDLWSAYVALRAWNGETVPRFTPEASLELALGPASIFATGQYADWGDFQVAGGYASLNLDLPLNTRVLAEIEEGDRGIYAEVPRKRYEYGRWTVGGEIAFFGKYRLGGRAGKWRVEPSLALGPPVDSLALVPGGRVGVVEGWAAGPIGRIFTGTLEVGGRYRQREDGFFLYWPKWEWRAEGEYRLLALADQLQVWLKAIGGVRGPMFVSDPSLGPGGARTTDNFNFFRGEAVIRIMDLYIYYNYEYFESVGGEPRDLLLVPLPKNRYHFGVKWEFWN